MSTPTLTDFLLARIAEDAAVANTEWPNDTGPHLSQCTLNAPEHTVIGDPWCDCGHPFDAANTRFTAGTVRPRRRCIACERARWKKDAA